MDCTGEVHPYGQQRQCYGGIVLSVREHDISLYFLGTGFGEVCLLTKYGSSYQQAHSNGLVRSHNCYEFVDTKGRSVTVTGANKEMKRCFRVFWWWSFWTIFNLYKSSLFDKLDATPFAPEALIRNYEECEEVPLLGGAPGWYFHHGNKVMVCIRFVCGTDQIVRIFEKKGTKLSPVDVYNFNTFRSVSEVVEMIEEDFPKR